MTNEDLARRLADKHPGLEFHSVVIDANVNAADGCLRGLIYLDQRGRFSDGEMLRTSPIDHVEEGGRIMVTQTGTRYLVALDAETELMRREASLEPRFEGDAPSGGIEVEPAGGMYEGAVALDETDFPALHAHFDQANEALAVVIGDPKLTIDWEALRVTAGPGAFSIGSPVVNGLSKLIEEAGEVIQVAGKVIALGGLGDHYDGSNLDERLHEELGDLLAAIDFVIVKNRLDKGAIEARRIGKRARFEEWNADARAAA